MAISKSKMFSTLLKKDLLLGKNENILIFICIVVVNLFAYIKLPLETAFPISSMLLFFIPLSIFFKAFTIIDSEWKQNTVYLMMSLPISGKMIYLSKLGALLIQWIILTIAALPFTVLMYFQLFINVSLPSEIINLFTSMPLEIAIEIGKISIIILLGFMLSLIMVFFSTTFGKLFKFSTVVAVTCFIFLQWLNGKLSNVFLERFSPTEIPNQLIGNGPFFTSVIGLIIISSILFLGATTIYEKKVEL